MATGIEWADETWNPVTGCDRVSPGCERCYAERMARRLAGRHGYPADEPFRVTLRPERLAEPLRWRAPRRVFVCSMSDLFHPDVPTAFLAEVFAVMAQADRHAFQVLTKRPQRLAKLLAADGRHAGNPSAWPLPNVWAGTSIESDAYTWRAGHLRQAPAAVRFLSLEPLLGALPSLDLTGIDWVIAGGESGPGARPVHPDWLRDVRDRCQAAGVPFFFKQWGSWAPPHDEAPTPAGPARRHEFADGATVVHLKAKGAAGRLLDGRSWDQFPPGPTPGNDQVPAGPERVAPWPSHPGITAAPEVGR